jgi:hypothetical protein
MHMVVRRDMEPLCSTLVVVDDDCICLEVVIRKNTIFRGPLHTCYHPGVWGVTLAPLGLWLMPGGLWLMSGAVTLSAAAVAARCLM